MSRRKKILVSVVAAFAIAAVVSALCVIRGSEKPAGRAPDPSRERYNVVLVSLDTLRADRLGCYGYDNRPTSPVIDGLAEEGVLFENYIASAPWTTPSHLSLLTSLYPSSHGVMTSFSEMWDGLKFGEQSYHKLPDSRTTLAEALAEKGFSTAAFTGGGPMDPAIGFDQGFEVYDTSMFKLDDENVGEMMSWIDDHASEQFFLFWHHYEVHAPYLHTEFVGDAAPAQYVAQITDETQEMARKQFRGVWPGDAALLRTKQRAMLRKHRAFNRDVCEALYTGNVLSADRWLGRVVDGLRKRGLYDRTLLVITSDHGEEFGDHHRNLWYNHHGHSVYEEMIHVPLIIKLPNSYAAGTRVPAICETIDVMPTILDVLDAAPARNEMQGRSLAPLWSSSAGRGDDRVAYTESTVARNEKKSVRTLRYKYIVNIDKETVAEIGRKRLPDGPLKAKLYDMTLDRFERRNLLEENATARSLSLAAGFERLLRLHIAAQRGEAAPTTLGAQAIERLKSLGYVEDGEPDAGAAEAGP